MYILRSWLFKSQMGFLIFDDSKDFFPSDDLFSSFLHMTETYKDEFSDRLSLSLLEKEYMIDNNPISPNDIKKEKQNDFF